MRRKVVSLVFLSFLLTMSMGLEAQSDPGLLNQLTDFIKDNPEKVSQDSTKENLPKAEEKKRPQALPQNLAFLDFGQRPLPDLKTALKSKPSEQASWLKDNQLVAAFDKRFQEYQEYILLNPEALSELEKKQIEDLFDHINAELNKLENTKTIKNHDEVLLGALSPKDKEVESKIKKQLGEQPHPDIIEGRASEAIADTDRTSMMRKPSFGGGRGPEEEEMSKSLDLVSGFCQDKAQAKIVQLDFKLLQVNVENLERALLDEANTIDERVRIYCTLLHYYELTDNTTRLVEFLYLNSPADDIKCP